RPLPARDRRDRRHRLARDAPLLPQGSRRRARAALPRRRRDAGRRVPRLQREAGLPPLFGSDRPPAFGPERLGTRALTARERLAGVLAPDVVDALEQLVAE